MSGWWLEELPSLMQLLDRQEMVSSEERECQVLETVKKSPVASQMIVGFAERYKNQVEATASPEQKLQKEKQFGPAECRLAPCKSNEGGWHCQPMYFKAFDDAAGYFDVRDESINSAK